MILRLDLYGEGPPPIIGPAQDGQDPNRLPPCQNHPQSPGVALCEACYAAVCQTCVFTFPGKRSFCPACATASSGRLSESRKGTLAWSLGLAIWNTLGLAAVPFLGAMMGSGDPKRDEAVLGTLFTFLFIIPTVIGFALALSSKEKRGSNPPKVWTAVWWNGALLGVWFLLVVAGLFLES